MTTRRRISTLLLSALAAGAGTVLAPLARAQTTIDKPLRIIVGFPAGGASDAVARLIADQLRGSYAPSVIVDNRAGAGGRLGAQAVKAADADGSTILVTPASILTIYPHVYRKLGYDALADFTPVSSVGKVSFALSVSAAVPVSVMSVADYVSWAKANPKDANFGSAAAGATPHFVGTMLGRASGAPLNHVPFKGGAPLVTDLLGGQIQSGVNVLTDVVPHAAGGKIRVLAVSGTKRSRFLPQVPTFAEAGFKDVEADEYFAVFAPSKTPPAVIANLNLAIRAALKTRPVIEGLEKLAFDVAGESPEEFRRIVHAELLRWGPIVRGSGFSSDD
ncbi:MAG: Bug family tripartite tricarboxylate transporter substrate binding protein [Betaproteobacteria bacterium]